MGHDEKNNEGEEHCEASKTKTTAKAATNEGHNDEHGHGHEHGGILRQMSESSIYATDQDGGMLRQIHWSYHVKERRCSHVIFIAIKGVD